MLLFCGSDGEKFPGSRTTERYPSHSLFITITCKRGRCSIHFCWINKQTFPWLLMKETSLNQDSTDREWRKRKGYKYRKKIIAIKINKIWWSVLRGRKRNLEWYRVWRKGTFCCVDLKKKSPWDTHVCFLKVYLYFWLFYISISRTPKQLLLVTFLVAMHNTHTKRL